jgi:hypothetical protein
VCIVLKCLVLAEQPAFRESHCFHCKVFNIVTDHQEGKMSESTDRTDCFISWVQIVICWYALCRISLAFRALMLREWGLLRDWRVPNPTGV